MMSKLTTSIVRERLNNHFVIDCLVWHQKQYTIGSDTADHDRKKMSGKALLLTYMFSSGYNLVLVGQALLFFATPLRWHELRMRNQSNSNLSGHFSAGECQVLEQRAQHLMTDTRLIDIILLPCSLKTLPYEVSAVL